ncbi:heavy-metal-associated domain-containing protein [Fluviicola sp.]|uniref:heavy-metal-associated domain-containing protein n=1 Tax=Fluviicola sp. TaxID=1917219 RepID=UPI0031D8E3FF
MKNALFIGIATVFMLGSCSSGEKKIISVEKKVAYKKLDPVHADRKLAVEVSGMSCEHACGGSIRMALKETGAVDRVSYDFESGRKTNTAYITFDKSKISADKIVSIIETINEKQFTTGKVSSTDIEGESKSESPVTSDNQEVKTSKIHVEVPETSWEIPNVFKFFARLID